jgi:hypothetical protein
MSTTDPGIISDRHGSGRRHWRDLSKKRLLLGLVLAPVAGIGLGALVLLLFEGMSGILWSGIGATLAAAETWSLPVGALYLIVARRRGVVRRAHCLLLGAFLAFSLPAAAYLTSKAVDWIYGSPPEHGPADEDVDDVFQRPSVGGLAVLTGLFLIPFGTAGGWVFWRVGAYPARPRTIDVATVFD